MADPKTTEQVQDISLKKFLACMRLNDQLANPPTPMIQENLEKTVEKVSDEERFISGLAALLLNVSCEGGRFDKAQIQALLAFIDKLMSAQLNEILHHPKFQQMESAWRALHDLALHTNFKANIMLDLLDVTKEELYEDFENNSVDISKGALFQKVYVHEYDQYGGKPYGGLLGMYEFEHTPKDSFWLKQMAKVANASHAPFVGAVSPRFFGCETVEELTAVKDLEGLMNQPKYGDWAAMRDLPEAPYLGLVLPRYILRLPYNPETNPCSDIAFVEEVNGNDSRNYLWGNSVALFARNMVRSFETSGWCQYLRGPKGGGLISGLPVHTFNTRGEKEIKVPVEVVIPDFRELEFANSGFIPLVYRKGTADACFFSCQSIKKPKKFKNPKDTENSQLVCNLSYTLSITRIAHYIKCIMRDNIGSSADAPYIKRIISDWLMNYVTTVVNPDDLTLKYYPFKAAMVEVKERPGMIGWYHCVVAILPHIQFEGMDVELRLESGLQKK